MASVVLGTVGRAVGTAVGGPVGGYIGGALGAGIGSRIDAAGGSKRHYEGARLEELAVQSSAYGRMIPILFGTMRLAGNVIWARPLKEIATTTTTRQGGKGGSRAQASSTNVSYSYYTTLAIAICEGEITRINRVWADAKLLDLSQGTYRVYRGTEGQLPDPLIESFEGVGATPAYRGLAYVVIEDFPIGDFGNRIPNFTFEVLRHAPQNDMDAQPVERAVRSVMLIPGSGEFVYDTQASFKVTGQTVSGEFVPQGYRVPLNQHTPDGKANMLVALDQMQQTFPNLEWVGVAANWFGSSMDIASCTLLPRVEFNANVAVTPQAWSVAGYTRGNAPLVGEDDGVARYGGTPDDASLQRLCDELRSRGLKVFFYPMLQMDLAGKPWRGYLNGSAAQVANFFTKAQGYNAFIQHYATLMAGRIDAFAIGSELRDLTGITSGAGNYPAVTQLVSLAANVRAILGGGVKLTYAADWSEYHHADGGWYHLDPLWASSNIDMVGIDAYFPLTDGVQTGYDTEAIRDGWFGGEGYDFYYTDPTRTTTAPLDAPYAWKNMAWWWGNTHTNPNGATTGWVPGSKPIWFTEYGFASVDGCSNEPNRFIDASSVESAYPRFSRGRVDFMAQRAAITATELAWKDSPMVVNKFLWTWDARPYPYWPDLREFWADGANWVSGHWVQGKLGASHVAAAVEQIAARVGIDGARIDTRDLQMVLDGFVVHQRVSARAAISQLMQGFFFTILERDGKLVAERRDQRAPVVIPEGDLVPQTAGDRQVPWVMTREEDIALPQRVEVQYLDRLQRFETQVESAMRHVGAARDGVQVPLGIVLSQTHARLVAEQVLAQRWSERSRVSLHLPMRYAALEPGDRLQLGGMTLRIEQVQTGRPGVVRITAARTEAEVWDGYVAPGDGAGSEFVLPPSPTRCEILDIPALPGDTQEQYNLRVAACGTGEGWRGASLLRIGEDGNETILTQFDRAAVMGQCLQVLGAGPAQVLDEVNTLEVALLGDGTLASTSLVAMLGGANVAVVGEELVQFMQATALGDGVYRLSRLLRGRLGTERHIASHVAGERFVLLDAAIATVPMSAAQVGQPWALRAVAVGESFGGGTVLSHTLAGESLRPYAPVHLAAVRSGGDIVLRWVRRARIDGGLRDHVDIPLMEQAEQYEVRVMSGSTVLRTWRTASTSQLYTAAEQLTDFGGAPTSLQMQVAQISALVGLGHFAAATLTVS
jgi:hypothetical protein